MPAANRRHRWLSIALGVAILCIGGALNIVLSMMKQAPATEVRIESNTAVATLTAQSQTYSERLIGYAKARPVTFSEIAAGVPGEIIWISSELYAGNFVEKGAELVRIDDDDLRSAVSSAEARLEQAHAELAQKEISQSKLTTLGAIRRRELETSLRMHERLKRLFAAQGVSESEFDDSVLQVSQHERAALEVEERLELAEPEVRRAKAEVAAAKAALSQARSDLKRTTVRAPFSGFIDERVAQLGSRVSVGSPLLRMVDNSQIEVPVALPANVYASVRKGSPATVRLEEDGPIVWQGNVSSVSPMINDEDRTFFAYLTISEAEVVPAGAFVIAEIEATQHSDVFVIPRTALVGDHLYVAARSNRDLSIVEERTPTIRKLLTAVALLDGGIENGEAVVVTNVEKISDGSLVKVTGTNCSFAGSAQGSGSTAPIPKKNTTELFVSAE